MNIIELAKETTTNYSAVHYVFDERQLQAFANAILKAAAKAAESAPIKTARQEQREACAVAIRAMKGGE